MSKFGPPTKRKRKNDRRTAAKGIVNALTGYKFKKKRRKRRRVK